MSFYHVYEQCKEPPSYPSPAGSDYLSTPPIRFLSLGLVWVVSACARPPIFYRASALLFYQLRPSVEGWYCAQATERIVILFRPSDRGILLFLTTSARERGIQCTGVRKDYNSRSPFISEKKYDIGLAHGGTCGIINGSHR